jgi:hypothetical protein
MGQKSRAKIPVAKQVEVLFRDGWLCWLCHRPTVFPLAMKHLAEFVRDEGCGLPTAFYDFRYRRDQAPMLDHLACVVDHVEAFSRGGLHDRNNLAVACNKCNARKSAKAKEPYLAENPRERVKGKYGEPQHWDGMVSVFVVLARRAPNRLTANERAWLQEIEKHLARRGAG